MKDTLNRFLFTLLLMLYFTVTYAENNPPPPQATAQGVSSTTPAPPGTPIDQNLIVLIVVGVLFGGYVIYKNSIKSKTSI